MFRLSILLPLIGTTLLSLAQSADLPRGHPYGRNCGYVGADPEPRIAIESFIQLKNTASIYLWLRDSDRALQAYATEAIIRLNRQGEMIAPDQLKRAKRLLRSRRRVDVCFGCAHWSEPLRKALVEFKE
jgi:hypothetical protein